MGRQLGDCSGFLVQEEEGEVRVKLQHEGSNAGLLDWVKLHTWEVDRAWVCPVGVRWVDIVRFYRFHNNLERFGLFFFILGERINYPTSACNRIGGMKRYSLTY